MVRNILYNGYQYEQQQRVKAPYQGPIYFDPHGKDVFSSANSNLAAH